MLAGRLGLETARIPQADRHGLLYLSRGNLYVENGCVRFVAATGGSLPSGDYGIPFQTVSLFMLGPGTTVSHDVLRLCARHGTGIVAVGEDGVRCYSAPPISPDQSQYARAQVRLWGDPAKGRIEVARRLYARRLGEVLPHSDIAVLRGIEGARMKESYKLIAQQFGIDWVGRHYDRGNPEASDHPNQAINHAATAVEAAAMIAVAATGTIPALGFIHEDSGNAWTLDIADLFRTEIMLPVAFGAVREAAQDSKQPLERHVRRLAGRVFAKKQLIAHMIDAIKEALAVDGKVP
jgi:CRISPR-associated protein Cas1